MDEDIDAGTSSPYKEIRSVTRAIEFLEAVANLGYSRIGELASYSGIDRATLYRLVYTLERKGYVMRRSDDGAISLTDRVLKLCDGVRDEDVVAQVISPFMKELTQKVLWPSDFATLAAGRITIQASSHKYSPMSVHRRLVGKTRPLLRSALGRAYLAALSRDDLHHTLEIVRRLGPADTFDSQALRNIDSLIDEIHQKGYAESVGLVEDNISAIALHVRLGRKPIGAINIVFFRRALTPAAAAAAYLDPLRNAIAKAEATLATLVG